MLTFEKVTLQYGKTKVIDALTAEAFPGRLTVLVGPNGAGKTSLLHGIAGRIGIGEGVIRFKDETIDTDDDEWRDNVSYVPASDGVLPILTVEEQLNLLCRLTGATVEESAERTDRIISYLQIESHRAYRGDELSSGLSKRLQIGLGIARDVDIYLLDEPFNGLDAESVAVLQSVLSVLIARNKYIFIASHILHFISTFPAAVWELDKGTLSTTYTGADAAERMKTLAAAEGPLGGKELFPWIH